MEAARKRDEEGSSGVPPEGADEGFPTPVAVPSSERNTPAIVPVIESGVRISAEAPLASQTERVKAEISQPKVDELLVCSLQGEVLHEWQCNNTNGRVGFLEFLSQKARQLARGLPLGDFDRLEMDGADCRVVAQIQSDIGLFVRTSAVKAEAPSGAMQP